MKDQKEIFYQLYDEYLREMMKAEFYEEFYQTEFADPKHMGKGKAGEFLSTWQSRKKHVLEHLKLLEEFAKKHGYW